MSTAIARDHQAGQCDACIQLFSQGRLIRNLVTATNTNVEIDPRSLEDLVMAAHDASLELLTSREEGKKFQSKVESYEIKAFISRDLIEEETTTSYMDSVQEHTANEFEQDSLKSKIESIEQQIAPISWVALEEIVVKAVKAREPAVLPPNVLTPDSMSEE